MSVYYFYLALFILTDTFWQCCYCPFFNHLRDADGIFIYLNDSFQEIRKVLSNLKNLEKNSNLDLVDVSLSAAPSGSANKYTAHWTANTKYTNGLANGFFRCFFSVCQFLVASCFKTFLDCTEWSVVCSLKTFKNST